LVSKDALCNSGEAIVIKSMSTEKRQTVNTANRLVLGTPNRMESNTAKPAGDRHRVVKKTSTIGDVDVNETTANLIRDFILKVRGSI
jgi:hypothetical protein